MMLCSERFHCVTMAWPNKEVKEQAKEWVEAHSCYKWRDVWWMVDGTLVPLFCRPSFFRNTWFDRKSNYSLNVQVSLFLLSFLSTDMFFCSSSQPPTCVSSTMVWACQGANTMQWLGRRCASPSNTTGFWMWVSVSGKTWPTRSRNGASGHTKSQFLFLF